MKSYPRLAVLCYVKGRSISHRSEAVRDKRGEFLMSNRLPIPADLLSLIEKRESEDRRVAQRLNESVPDSESMPRVERREGERRNARKSVPKDT